MSAVTLEGLFKSYGSTPVVKGLSLTIAEGEFLSLLGPSGCGKTTTLRMIAGLERPDAGTITLGTQQVDGPGLHVPPEQRGLSMVFQSYAVWPHRSVAQNVAYPLVLQRVPTAEREARVKEALAQVRLSALGERLPQELSGGQLQRVALARALVARPKVLLLDEPLSNLDAALREELRAELATLRDALGLTAVFVTHDQAEALALSTKVAVMQGGVIEQLAAPRALYDAPATAFVAHFVGGANLLQGHAAGGTFHAGGLSFAVPGLTREGPCTLAVRPEDLLPDASGTLLTVATRLFQGATTELRLAGGTLAPLRAVGPALAAFPVGGTLAVRVARAFAYAP